MKKFTAAEIEERAIARHMWTRDGLVKCDAVLAGSWGCSWKPTAYDLLKAKRSLEREEGKR